MTPEAMAAKLRYHARRSNNSEMKADLSSIAQTIENGLQKETVMDDTPETTQTSEELPPLVDPPEGAVGLGDAPTEPAPDAPDTTQPASDEA